VNGNRHALHCTTVAARIVFGIQTVPDYCYYYYYCVERKKIDTQKVEQRERERETERSDHE
jgi:hypothetical protein